MAKTMNKKKIRKRYGITDPKIFAAIDSFIDVDGVHHPEDMVKAARNNNHVLHSRFEWDDLIAGHEYRIQQARFMMRCCVSYDPNDPTETPFRRYYSLSTDRENGGGYRKLDDILSNRDLRKILLDDAARDAELFLQKYQHLQELAQVTSVIRTFVASKNKKRP